MAMLSAVPSFDHSGEVTSDIHEVEALLWASPRKDIEVKDDLQFTICLQSLLKYPWPDIASSAIQMTQ